MRLNDYDWSAGKVVVGKRRLRDKDFRGNGVLVSEALYWPGTSLRLRVMVFERGRDAVRWAKGFPNGGDVRACAGFYMDCVDIGDDGRVVDKKYWGVVGFMVDELSEGLIAHEAVHAACGYSWRTKCRTNWPGSDMSAEEHLAYPVELIVNGVCGLLRARGIKF